MALTPNILAGVDPHAWLLTLPVTLAITGFCLLGHDHPLKRRLRDAHAAEAHALAWIMLALGRTPRPAPDAPGEITAVQRGLLVACLTALALATGLSLARFLLAP